MGALKLSLQAEFVCASTPRCFKVLCSLVSVSTAHVIMQRKHHTPLTRACQQGMVEVARLCIVKGAPLALPEVRHRKLCLGPRAVMPLITRDDHGDLAIAVVLY
jgi:hypothetical protein